jgi:hypothetical protein
MPLVTFSDSLWRTIGIYFLYSYIYLLLSLSVAGVAALVVFIETHVLASSLGRRWSHKTIMVMMIMDMMIIVVVVVMTMLIVIIIPIIPRASSRHGQSTCHHQRRAIRIRIRMRRSRRRSPEGAAATKGSEIVAAAISIHQLSMLLLLLLPLQGLLELPLQELSNSIAVTVVGIIRTRTAVTVSIRQGECGIPERGDLGLVMSNSMSSSGSRKGIRHWLFLLGR